MINYRVIAKLAAYLSGYALLVYLMYVMSQVMWGTNTQGATCDTYIWQADKIVATVNINMYFQWFFQESSDPCRFTEEFYFCIYFVAIPLYCLFRLFYKSIWQKPASLSIKIIEFVVGWCIYLHFLLNVAYAQGIEITLNVFYNAFVGTFLLLFPILCLIILMLPIRKLGDKFFPKSVSI